MPNVARVATRVDGGADDAAARAEAELDAMASELVERYEELTVLYDLTAALGRVVDVDDQCAVACERAARAVGATSVQVELVGGTPVAPAAGDEPELVVPVEAAGVDGSHETIGRLVLRGGDGFDAGDAKLASAVAHQLGSAIQSVRMISAAADQASRLLVVEEELRRAAEVQRGLLPRRVPELPGWDFAGVCVPSRSVGGDFFDWHAGAGGVVVTLADVMGKGMAGALVMATVRAVLRGTGRLASLGDAVDQASSTLVDDLQETSSFVTLLHARVEPGGCLRYVDAGHGLAAVVRADGAVERLVERGIPVGILADASWVEGTTLLAPGDSLLAFSDGLLDLHGDPSSEAEVAALLTELAAVVSSAPTSREAVAALSAGATDLPDDVTIVVVRRCS